MKIDPCERLACLPLLIKLCKRSPSYICITNTSGRKTTIYYIFILLCFLYVVCYFCIFSAKVLFLEWSNLRRVYTYLMTLNLRRLISRHRDLLFSEEAQRKYGPAREKNVFSATSLLAVDENYGW